MRVTTNDASALKSIKIASVTRQKYGSIDSVEPEFEMASVPQPDLPATMRVLQMSGYGGYDVLQYVEAKAPRLLYPTDIIIRVHAAGVNPVEDKLRQGNMALLMRLTFPYVLGRDFCGTIVSKGDEVNNFNIGDEVFGTLPDPSGENGSGTYAE